MSDGSMTERRHVVRVLLVEDNPGDARLVEILLAEDGDTHHHVTRVATLAGAVALVGQSSFDVVLTDLGLPDSNGSETVDAILRAWPDVPVVVLTGLADRDTGTKAVQSGCQDYLVKGFDDPQLLQRTIRYAIERAISARDLRESEERFRTLVEVSPDAILMCSDHQVLFANPAAVSVFGAAGRQDLHGINPARLFGPTIHQAIRDALTDQSCKDETHRETALTRFDASRFDAEITIAPIHHKGHPAVEVIVRDITERKIAERQHRLAAAVFDTTDEAMLVTDADNKIVAVNPAFERVTGYDAAEVEGLNPHVLSSGRHDKHFFAEMWTELQQAGHWHGEMWNRRKSGEVYVQRLTLSLIRDAEGRVVNHVGVFSDITDEKQEAERIRYRASYDALTSLPNRALLHDRLQQALAKACRETNHLGVLFLDLDGFKPVNDRWGHLTGDHLLVAVAERLRACVRESDTVARLGGDEFVILLPDIMGRNDAETVAQKVISALGEPFVLGDVCAHIGTSIGIAMYPEHGQSGPSLVNAADHAMYAAKQTGKGRFVFVASDLKEQDDNPDDDGGIPPLLATG